MRLLLSSLVVLGLAAGAPAYAQDAALHAAIKAHLPKKGPAPEFGKPIMADLDGDGRPEAVVRYCINESDPGGKFEGANNASTVHCHVAILENGNGRWRALGEAAIGQGEVREVKNGVIYVETLSYKPKDPLCCPSQKRVARLAVKNKRLVQLR